MDKIKCKICKMENLSDCHYCISCGYNLSNKVEKTDVLFSISMFLKVLAFILLFNAFGLFGLLSMFGVAFTSGIYVYLFYVLPFVFFLVSFLIKRLALKKCKENLVKIEK